MANRAWQARLRDAANTEYYAKQFAQHNKRPAETVNPIHIGQMVYSEFPSLAIRLPKEFSRSLKTKDIGKIRLAYATHLFTKYSVPYHLQMVWLSTWQTTKEYLDNRANNLGQPVRDHGLTGKLAKEQEIKRMFITVGRGGSLYKEHTKAFFTKKETHNFLNCPLKISFDEAIYYALAKSHTDDIGIITRIFKSKLTSKNYKLEFWREVVRYFCVNPIPINEMNDLLDFISNQFVEDPLYSIKGRSIASLKIQMEQWHRTISRSKRMGNARWDGVPIPDKVYEDMVGNKGGSLCDWKMYQLKTSSELAKEGSAMHHCVYSYQAACISGNTSIWSLRRKAKLESGFNERALTIEVRGSTVVQIRGYANRLARPFELDVVTKWANENNLTVQKPYW